MEMEFFPTIEPERVEDSPIVIEEPFIEEVVPVTGNTVGCYVCGTRSSPLNFRHDYDRVADPKRSVVAGRYFLTVCSQCDRYFDKSGR